MKKYLLFAGQDYYPCGGWTDFVAESDSLDELHEIADKPSDQHPEEKEYEWYHIVDTHSKSVVFDSQE